jgi:hypothetical protein
VRAVGLRTGWGDGVAALPGDARAAAAGRPLIALGPAPVAGERFRRSTREALWGLAAVHAMLEDGAAPAEAIAGDRTALLFVTAAAYGPSNRAFILGSGAGAAGASGTHFAYTAPAVLPAEIAIELGVRGPGITLIGGAPATLHAIWQAAECLERGTCDRALVVAVEVFAECGDLHRRAGRWVDTPLVEVAACVWLEPGEGALRLGRPARGARGRAPLCAAARRRAGELAAGEPLAALALWRAGGGREPLRLSGAWNGDAASLEWGPAPEEDEGEPMTVMAVAREGEGGAATGSAARR